MIKELLMGGLLACAVCGCSSLRPAPPVATFAVTPAKLQVRNNAASLLSDLLKDEQNVDKVLIVKSASPDISALVKLIAATAATHERELQEMATNDPALNLKVTELPPGEIAARDATAKATEHDLLFSTGPHFEFNLLYCQAEAQNYGWHLAAVAANNSERADEAHLFDTIGKTMERLDQQVLAEIRGLPAH